MCRWKVLVFHVFVLCLLQDDDLSPKLVAEVMSVDEPMILHKLRAFVGVRALIFKCCLLQRDSV
jgi:hypothetical protein